MSIQRTDHRTQNWAILLALGMALLAQSAFTAEPFKLSGWDAWTREQRQSVGVGLMLAAIGCSAWAASRFWKDERPDERPQPSSRPAEHATQRIVLAVALGCYAVSLGLYVAIGEGLIVQVLWLAGLAALLLSQQPVSAIKADLQRIEWWEWWLVTAITAVGFLLRYWRLTEIPSHVDNDVAVMGTYSLEMIQSGQTKWFGFASSDHSLFNHQLLAWSMRLFGQDHYGLVIKSVIAGTLTLPVVFLLGREMFGRRVGLIAMALLTISYTHIHFSRILFTPIPTLLVTLLLYWLFRGLRTRHGFWYALAGIACGLALLVYYSGRIAPVIVAALVGWGLMWQRREAVTHWRNWGLLIAGTLLGFGPMLGFAILNLPLFVGRGNTVMLFNPLVYAHSMDKYQVNSVGALLLEQVQRAFLAYHFYIDESPHFAYPGPMVSALTAILLAVGLGFCLSRLKDLRYFALVAWIALALILGGVLTSDPPYWPHLAMTLPAVMLVAALAANRIMDLLSPLGQSGKWMAIGLLAVALVFVGVQNWLKYTAHVRDNAGPRIRIARYLNSLPGGYQVRLVSDDWPWSEHAFRFFNRGIPGADLEPAQLQSDPPHLDQPTVFILFRHPELVPLLQRQYPDGEWMEHLDSEKQVAFISYRVVPKGYAFPPSAVSPSVSSRPGWWILGGATALWAVILGGVISLPEYRRWRGRQRNGDAGTP